MWKLCFNLTQTSKYKLFNIMQITPHPLNTSKINTISYDTFRFSSLLSWLIISLFISKIINFIIIIFDTWTNDIYSETWYASIIFLTELCFASYYSFKFHSLSYINYTHYCSIGWELTHRQFHYNFALKSNLNLVLNCPFKLFLNFSLITAIVMYNTKK